MHAVYIIQYVGLTVASICYFVNAVKDGLTSPIIMSMSERCRNEAGELPELTEKSISDFVFNRKRGRKWDRPVRHAWKPIEVGIQLGVQTLIEINERTQLVRLNGFFVIVWFDEIHTWNETYPYQCVEYLIIPHGDETGLWVPEIAIINADYKYAVTAAPEDLLRFYSDGTAQFAPGGIIKFLCTFDLSLFPFDKQICTIHMEAWRYTTRYLYFASSSVVSINQTPHEQWDIFDMTSRVFEVTYPNGNAFSTVQFNLHLKRKYGYYLLTIIIPCLLVAAIEIVTFSMPYNKGIRLEVSFTCLLAFSVFQTMVVSDLPKSADNPPLMMILISILTFLITIAIFFQSVTMYMAGRAENAKTLPPRLVFKKTLQLAPFVLVEPFEYTGFLPQAYMIVEEGWNRSSRKREATSNKGTITPILSKRKARTINRTAWHFLARVTDRYSCLLFVALFIFACLATLIIIPTIGLKI